MLTMNSVNILSVKSYGFRISKDKLMKNALVFWFLAVVSFCTATTLFGNRAIASSSMYESIDFTRAMPEEQVEDMSVKVLGGAISVNRFYRVMKRSPSDTSYPGVSGDLEGYSGNTLLNQAAGVSASDSERHDYGVWQFHRKWHDLVLLDINVQTQSTIDASNSLENAPASGSSLSGPRFIDRNDYLYIRKPGENYYVYEHNGNDLRISLTSSGFKWSDRSGEWIEYDQEGRALRSGNRNGITMSIERENGLIVSYKDHFDNVIVTWEYENKKPIKATDYSGREVLYKWQGDDLIEVTTTRGHVWKYGYDSFGANRVMVTKTDPEEQIFTYQFQMSKGGFQVQTSSLANSPDLAIIGDIDIGVSTASRAVSNTRTTSQVVEPMLMHIGMIYPDGKKVRYYYQYDDASQSYMILSINSDGLEEERWFDLDGNIRYHLKGGKVSSLRVRNGVESLSRDAYGNSTSRSYTRFEAIESVTYADGGTVKYEYLSNYNFVTLVTDQLGFKTKHEYDSKGNRIKTIAGFDSDDERITEYEYDQYGQQTVVRFIGRTNVDGSVSRTVEMTTEYDNYGNVIKRTDGNGNVITFKEFTAIGHATKVTDGRGNTRTLNYDDHGNLISRTSSLGFVEHTEYDSLNRITRQVDAEQRETTYEYDARNKPFKTTDNAGGVTESRYRIDGGLLSYKDQSGLLTNYTYDRVGRVTEVIDGVGNKTITRYVKQDEISGNLVESVETPNTKEVMSYDALNREISRNQLSVKDDNLISASSSTYTLRGNMKTATDANGHTSSYSYNAHNQISIEVDAIGNTVHYDYDHRGSLARVTDALNFKTYCEYDGEQNRVSETRPYVGDRDDAIKQRYEFDANNNQVRKTDYNGNVAKFIYDKDNRLAGFNNTLNTEPIKDGSKAERSITYSYDKTGLPLTYQDNLLSTAYEYDELARLTKQTSNFGVIPGVQGSLAFSKTLNKTYYPNGQLKQHTDPEGNSIAYAYDAAGKLKQMSVQGVGSILVNEYQGFLPTAISYPGGINRQLAYDGLARLTQINVQNNAGNPILNLEYGFDNKGNITSRNANGQDNQYGYDNIDRLTSAQQPNQFGNQSFTYDGNGNRTNWVKETTGSADVDITNNRTEESYAYSDWQELLGQTDNANNSYDANGALLLNPEKSLTFTHNSHAHIASVALSNGQSVNYLYDGKNRRIVKAGTDSATVFLYDETGSGLIAEYTAQGELIRGYGYEPGGLFTTDPVTFKTPTDTGYDFAYYQNDHLGTPQQLVKSSGEVIWQASYDAFGEVVLDIETVEQPLRFPGQYYDLESELHYNWNRYYDSGVGRYVSSDPIGKEGGKNLFIYAKNSPLYYLDPYGLKVKDDSSPGRKTGPWHPPTGTKTKCRRTDKCPTIKKKLYVLTKMIRSHTGWDKKNAWPRGVDRHAEEIGDLWLQWTKCNALKYIKCKGKPKPRVLPMFPLIIDPCFFMLPSINGSGPCNSVPPLASCGPGGSGNNA